METPRANRSAVRSVAKRLRTSGTDGRRRYAVCIMAERFSRVHSARQVCLGLRQGLPRRMCEVRRLFLQFDGRAHCRVAREGFNAPAATPVAPTRIFDLCLKDGKLYCKADYTRLFAEKCAFCAEAIAGVIPALHRHGDSFCLLTIQTLRCCGLAGGPAGGSAW